MARKKKRMSISSEFGDVGDEELAACKLYLITPPTLELRVFYDQLSAALDAGLDAETVGCVQLRLKDVSDDVILGAAEMLMPVAHERNVPFLINDRPDLAAAAGADGVHIGQHDASYEEARDTVGNNAIVGVTCHDSRHLAMIAGEKDADYVAFGAMFPSSTKEASTHATPELIQWWRNLTTVQCVAIGGITPENCPTVVAAGADFLAVSAGVWEHSQGPAGAVRAFGHIFDNVNPGDGIQ
jgi:thiamine-phosphate pyrophosphorylase